MEIFDPLSPEMLKDPYPVYSTLRREDPVHRHDGLDAWVVTRYADCVRILQDPQTFGSDFRVIGETVPDESLTLLTLDPPEHTALRWIAAAGLRKVDPRELAVEVEKAIEKQLMEVDTNRFDFITEFAEPVAIASMCTFFGIPRLDDVAAFRAAQRNLLVSFDSGLAPETLEPGQDARSTLNAMIDPLLDRPPRHGVLSGINLTASGPPRIQVLNALRGIFGAGYGSSSSMWGLAMRVLVDHDLLDRPEPLQVNPTVVNELIRYDGAVQAVSRAVGDDTVIGDRAVRRGDTVVVVLASANRDPDVFAGADNLDLARKPNPHIGFGKGIHACLGCHLGMRIGVQIFSMLARSFRVTLLEEPVQRPTATLRGLDRLMVQASRR